MRRRLLSLVCWVAGHRYRQVGWFTPAGFRRQPMVHCDRCHGLWRGVKPLPVNRRVSPGAKLKGPAPVVTFSRRTVRP